MSVFLIRLKYKVNIFFCLGLIDFFNYIRKIGFYFLRSLFDIKWLGISVKVVIKI